MSSKNSTVNGPAPSGANTAVLVLDMISDFTFEDGDRLYPHALEVAHRLSDLKFRAKKANVPLIYVNDNFGNWHSDFFSKVEAIKENSPKGRRIIELLDPEEDDFHILKPQRSAFYATPLEVLLLTLNISDIILTGITSDICVFFSAHDAYMRGFRISVPSDCSAAVEENYHLEAMAFLERVTDADIRPSGNIEFEKQDLKRGPNGREQVKGQSNGS